LAILLGTLATYVAVRLSGRHLAKLVARTSTRGSLHERENRALTLVGVFRNIASIAVIAVGLLMALEAVGIPIVPLMGGAAVVGLAVAFGAQNLVRDYFAGFMVLLEDQYGINDVVKIGDIAGAVEQITLRVTTLRDLEGIVHFVPHGTITTVSNMTHGWSRALLEIGVAYKEDTDRVMDVMLEVARELRKDSAFGPFILGDPEMLGVDSFGDSAVLIKMCIKTQPLKRWAVKRELLRRVKHKFDELGIEIPFPHRTLFLREAEGESREAIRRN
jgi:small conductance mechanosensitive channel